MSAMMISIGRPAYPTLRSTNIFNWAISYLKVGRLL
jgi:hypothetical protein